MIIRPYEPGDVLKVALPRRGQPSEAIDALALASAAWSFSAVEGETVLGCGGVLRAADWRAMAWAVIGSEASPRALVRMRQRMKLQLQLIEADGVTTIEAEVAERFTGGHAWVRALGFRLVGVVPGPEGGFLRYARWTPAAAWPGNRVRALLDLTERVVRQEANFRANGNRHSPEAARSAASGRAA